MGATSIMHLKLSDSLTTWIPLWVREGNQVDNLGIVVSRLLKNVN